MRQTHRVVLPNGRVGAARWLLSLMSIARPLVPTRTVSPNAKPVDTSVDSTAWTVARRARMYSPHLRTFLSPDLLGYVDGFNRWQYVAGDPLNLVDPWGMTWKDAAAGAADGATFGFTRWVGLTAGADRSSASYTAGYLVGVVGVIAATDGVAAPLARVGYGTATVVQVGANAVDGEQLVGNEGQQTVSNLFLIGPQVANDVGSPTVGLFVDIGLGVSADHWLNIDPEREADRVEHRPERREHRREWWDREIGDAFVVPSTEAAEEFARRNEEYRRLNFPQPDARGPSGVERYQRWLNSQQPDELRPDSCTPQTGAGELSP